LEQSLRESDERFRSAFEYAAVGMALVSPEGRWLRVNQALCRIVGYGEEELLNTDFQSITHPEDSAPDRSLVREMLAGDRSYVETETRYRHKAGHTIWILLSVSMTRDSRGQPIHFIAQMQEITERKRLEQALRDLTSQEQQRLGRDLHDGLAQELTGLSLLARAFATKAERLDSPLAAEALALSRIAGNAVATCRDIVRGVSPLTESQGGLVRGIRQLADRAALLHGHPVRFSATENAPVLLPWESRNQLFRVTQEALANALAHSGADNIRVSIVIDIQSVDVVVADDGKGLEGLAANLEPRGFGIEAMRYRAAALNAQIAITATPGGGTTVTCRCPQPAASSATPPGL